MSGLAEEFQGRVVARNVDATTTEAREEIAELGFDNHGLAIRGPDGEVLFKQADHTVEVEKVRMALREMVGGP